MVDGFDVHVFALILCLYNTKLRKMHATLQPSATTYLKSVG